MNMSWEEAIKRERIKALSCWTFLLLYVYLLVKVILLKFQTMDFSFLWGQLLIGLQEPYLLSIRLESANLVPFREINRSLQSLSDHAMVNLFGNVAIFLPLGFVLAFMWNRVRMAGVKIVSCAFLLSLGLETAQLVFMIGQFDVDDILLNTLGGLLGFIVYRTVRFVMERTEQYETHYDTDRRR